MPFSVDKIAHVHKRIPDLRALHNWGLQVGGFRKPLSKPPFWQGRLKRASCRSRPSRGSLSYCTCTKEAISTKSAGRKWLVSGLEAPQEVLVLGGLPQEHLLHGFSNNFGVGRFLENVEAVSGSAPASCGQLLPVLRVHQIHVGVPGCTHPSESSGAVGEHMPWLPFWNPSPPY